MPPKAGRDDGTHDVLFIDNGGYEIKALYLPQHGPARTLVVPNCVGAASYAGRGIVGTQINQLPHYHGFLVRRPVASGFIVDGVLQAHIWEYVLEYFSIEDEASVALWLTVPFGAPKAVAQLLYALLTQRFRFYSLTCVSSTFLALLAYSAEVCHGAKPEREGQGRQALKRPRLSEVSEAGQREVAGEQDGTDSDRPGCGIVVDVGFSGTTIVPYIDAVPVYSSILRLSVGGKLLTNRLNEHLSFTQVNLLADGWLVNHIKEQCCALALRPRHGLAEIERMRESALPSPTGRRAAETHEDDMTEVVYMLPTVPALYPLGCVAGPRNVTATQCKEDTTDMKDEAADDSLQKIKLKQERYMVPELLFTPGDVGLEEQGLGEAIRHGVFARGLLSHLPLLRKTLLAKVCVFGGTSRFPAFPARLAAELAAENQEEGREARKHGVRVYHAPLAHTRQPTGAQDTLAEAPVGGGDTKQDIYNSCLKSTNPVYIPLQGAYWLLTVKEAEQQRDLIQSRSALHLHRHQITWLDIQHVMERLL